MLFPFSISDALAASALSTGTLSVLGYLMFPRVKEGVWMIIEGDKGRFDKMRRQAIDADPQYAKHFVKEVLKDELGKLNTLQQQADGHDEALGFLQHAIMEQTKEIKQLPSISAALQQNAQAFTDVSRTLREIHTEMADHTKQLAKWDGFMQGLDGKWRTQRK